MGKIKQEQRRARQAQLLTMFEGDFYQELHRDGKWYIKMFNGGTGKWQVAEYSEQSYQNYKSFQQPKAPTQEQRKAKFEETKAYWEAKRIEEELDEELARKLQ